MRAALSSLRWVRLIPRLAAGLAMAIAGVVLLGWELDVELFKRMVPGLVAMNPTTACAFILAALSLWWAARNGALLGGLRGALGVVLAVVGLVKLLDLMLGTDTGVDRMIFAAKLAGPGTLNTNAMAPNTAFNMVLTGISMLCLALSGRDAIRLWISQGCAVGTILLSLIAIMGYAFGAFSLYHVGTFFPMALHTAICFLLVSVGSLWLHPRRAVMAIITSADTGGRTARKLLIGVSGVPLVLGLAWVLFEQKGIFESSTRVALFITFNIFVLVAIVLWTANQLHAASVNLRRRTRELEAANLVADMASRAKSSFLANMSHEIRTPMNGVLGMLELLQHTPLSDEQVRTVNTIQGSAHSLLAIINDILDISKIEAGRMSVEALHTDVAEAIEATARLFVGAATAKGITLRCFIAPEIRGRFMTDPVRLRQILSNLISNAVKFTSRGGVTVACELLEGEAPGALKLRLSVTDTGIGISEQALQGLFQPFAQAEESTARRYGGTGLGLSISVRLAALMHGKIGLTSKKGMGTTASVELPTTAEEEILPPAADLGGIRVLLVSANADERRYFADYLKFWGAYVMAVSSPAEMGNTLQAGFDIVLAPQGWADPVLREAGVLREDQLPPTLQLRFVFYTHGDQPRDLQVRKDAILTTALSRARMVTAVAVATARESPEIEQPQDLPDAAGAAPDRAQALREQRLILLAEDHPVNQRVVLGQLALLGYAADAVENGELALQALARNEYALLLTDCNMPEMDGFTLTARIRAGEKEGGHRLPIIALTANAMAGEHERCIKAGMDDYLSKPTDMQTLGKTLRRWMSSPAPGWGEPSAPAAAAGAAPASVNGTRHAPDLLDLTALQDVFGDDEAAMQSALRDFSDCAVKDIEAVQHAVAANDAEATEQAAHRLKGAARIVGAVSVADYSQAVESAAKHQDWRQVSGHLPQLAAALDDVRGWISRQQH